jgi:hypothetical protein
MGAAQIYKHQGEQPMSHPAHDHNGEIEDLPFVKNDMKEDLPTMDKPLNSVDAPGRADSEMVEEVP